MPFTPYHLGPGAAFKAIGGSRFSLLIFAGSQVLMDIEPLVRILRRDLVLHGPSHTVLGALAIGVAAGVVGRPISEFALRVTGIGHRPITWPVAFASAFLGTYSHIVLDGMMHADINPLWPFVPGNPLLGAISLGALHVACVLSGSLGIGALGLRGMLAAKAAKPRG
jgi:hypothetical protein